MLTGPIRCGLMFNLITKSQEILSGSETHVAGVDSDPLYLREPLKCFESLNMFLWQLAVCTAETDYV